MEKLTREFLEQEDAMHGDGQVKLEDRVDIAIDTFRQWLADEGLVVVPKSLTEEMTQALWFEISCVHPDQGLFRRGSENTVWRHTLAAAPDALKGD
jgi:hypothetical protein